MQKIAFFIIFSIHTCIISLNSYVYGDDEVSTDINDVRFYLYRLGKPMQEVKYGNSRTLGNMKPGAHTTVIITGFMTNLKNPMNSRLSRSALAKNKDENVIVVEWSKLNGATLGGIEHFLAPEDSFTSKFFGGIELALTYKAVVENVVPVGGRVADFIHFITKYLQIPMKQVHIIGHSLGAHIGGSAGYALKEKYNQLPGRITGLDPAGPLFTIRTDMTGLLNQEDAAFVDIYHTNRGVLGKVGVDTGDVNVYVNSGISQPSCNKESRSIVERVTQEVTCSHSYAWKLYDLTYEDKVLACPCADAYCSCTLHGGCYTSCSDPIPIGDKLPITRASGPYYVHIDAEL